MATFETIKHCVFLLRSTCEFPLTAAKKDEFGNMIRPGTLEAWHMALEDLSDGQVMAGTKYLLGTLTDDFKRKPMPGDIRAFLNRADMPDPGEVWAEIEAKKWDMQSAPFVRELGRCVSPSWSSEYVAEVVRQMGGVEVFLNMRTSQEPTIRAQLKGICESVASRKAARHIPVPGLAAPNDPKVALIAEARAKKEQREAAEAAAGEIADQKVRSKLAELRELMEAQKAAKDKEKMQKRREEQQAFVRAAAELQGIELTTFNLPEVLEG